MFGRISPFSGKTIIFPDFGKTPQFLEKGGGAM